MYHSADVLVCLFFFFFNDTATTEIYTLSLHDALPIWHQVVSPMAGRADDEREPAGVRSEEHTSELQSRSDLVCRLLLEKKNKTTHWTHNLVFHHLVCMAATHSPAD